MTDKAYTGASSSFDAAMSMRSRQTGNPRSHETVVNLPTRPGDAVQPTADERLPLARTSDWTSAIDLIQEASEAIRISEERADELESQLDQVMAQAAEEMRRLNAELTSSEERLRLAEARAVEVEGWLVRLHDAVHNAFTPLQRRTRGSGSLRPHEAPLA